MIEIYVGTDATVLQNLHCPFVDLILSFIAWEQGTLNFQVMKGW